MPKNSVKFSVLHQKEFPFLKPVTGNETEVLCTLCDTKFGVGNGGRAKIIQHIETKKHIKAKKTTSSNKPITSFLENDPAMMQLSGKELTFAYHSARHQMSGPTVDCNSVLIRQLFEPKFTCSAKKTAKLVQNVSRTIFVWLQLLFFPNFR